MAQALIVPNLKTRTTTVVTGGMVAATVLMDAGAQFTSGGAAVSDASGNISVKHNGGAAAAMTVAAGGKGTQGGQGGQGTQGGQGAQGPQGYQGYKGNPGYGGNRGFPGSDGGTGARGTQGPQGYDGNTGNPGYPGNTGPTGYQGIAYGPGTQGYQGDRGPMGEKGATGGRGTQGGRGSQGGQGGQGGQGPQGAMLVNPVEYDTNYPVYSIWEQSSTLIGAQTGTNYYWTYFQSDAKLKKDIEPCTAQASDALQQIRFIRFRHQDEAPSVRHEVGFSAQQLRSVDPEFASDTDPMVPHFPILLTYLLKALQEQIQRVRALREAVRVLREAA